MAVITILGAGVMGTGFSVPAADNGHDVRLVGTHLDAEIIDALKNGKPHPKHGVIPPNNVRPFHNEELKDALQGADLVVIAVNSLGVEWAADRIGREQTESTPYLLITKGYATLNGKLTAFPYLLRHLLPDHLKKGALNAITGPCVAGELGARQHSTVLWVGEDMELLEKLANLVRTDYYQVWTDNDIIGAEVCAAFKNVYALVQGTGKGFFEVEGPAYNGAGNFNVQTTLFTQALYEISLLVEYLGGTQRSVLGLPGAGDLYVTCMAGRNGKMGRLLGMGIPYSKAKAEHMPDDTLEGAELLKILSGTFQNLLDTGKLDPDKMPLLQLIMAMICEDASPKVAWERFFKT
jgi:glycerol-3-phosphate dehydrogenase (NAD(P)+)